MVSIVHNYVFKTTDSNQLQSSVGSEYRDNISYLIGVVSKWIFRLEFSLSVALDGCRPARKKTCQRHILNLDHLLSLSLVGSTTTAPLQGHPLSVAATYQLGHQ